MGSETKPSHRNRNVIIGTVVVAALLFVGFIVLELSLFRDDQEAGLAALEGTSVDASTLPVTVPFSFVAGHIVVEATLEDGGEPVALILDTGAPTVISDDSLTINPDDLAGIGIDVDPSGPAVGLVASGAAGNFDARMIFADVDLRLGDLQLAGSPAAAADSLQAGQGNIGNAFLSNFVVTIDWPEETIYFDPVSDDARPPTPAAAKIGWDGESITVGSVVEGSDVAETGLAIGQPISSIDGQDVSDATRDDFCALYIAGQPDEWDLALDSGANYRITPVAHFYLPAPES